MAPGKPTDRDATLMKLSALLDGELPKAEQDQLFDAMAQDPALLHAFEALAAARSHGVADGLSSNESADLTASVMAAVDPDDMPATAAGALALSSLAIDGERYPHAALSAALAAPGAAAAVTGFVAATELARAGGQALADLPEVHSALAPVTERVDAHVAAADRAGTLALAAADAALTATEHTELASLYARIDAPSFQLLRTAPAVKEALSAATDSAVFARHAQKAGDAALNAIDALARAAAPAAPRPAVTEARPSLAARLWQTFAGARLPLAFAGAAAALFFAIRPSTDGATVEPGPRDDLAIKEQIVNALAPIVLAEAPHPTALPLLADNDATVEALDANGTTMVFSTEASNITVIWVSGDDDGEEQGT